MKNQKNKIVVYGGAFSPPHIGHAVAVESIVRLFPCDEIWVMPTADRLDKKMSAPADDRIAMLELWLNEYFGKSRIPIKISDIELKRPELTTTYKTKLELEEKFSDSEFYFYIGSDILGDIEPKWVNGKELYQKANFIVFKKAGGDLSFALPPHITILEENVILVNASSTFIRNLIKSGLSGIPYVPRSIADYIAANHLYQ